MQVDSSGKATFVRGTGLPHKRYGQKFIDHLKETVDYIGRPFSRAFRIFFDTGDISSCQGMSNDNLGCTEVKHSLTGRVYSTDRHYNIIIEFDRYEFSYINLLTLIEIEHSNLYLNV